MNIFLAILTATLTLAGGVVLILIGRTVEVLVVTPLKKYKQSVLAALERITFYSNRLTNYFSDDPDDEERRFIRTMSEEIRVAATTLEAAYLGISGRDVLSKRKLIPSADQFAKAYGQLIFLSNNVPRPERERGRQPGQGPIDLNHKAIETIKSILGGRS